MADLTTACRRGKLDAPMIIGGTCYLNLADTLKAGLGDNAKDRAYGLHLALR